LAVHPVEAADRADRAVPAERVASTLLQPAPAVRLGQAAHKAPAARWVPTQTALAVARPAPAVVRPDPPTKPALAVVRPDPAEMRLAPPARQALAVARPDPVQRLGPAVRLALPAKRALAVKRAASATQCVPTETASMA
jgi:hypothetical protein